jgi:acetyl/propionyl-CoA carboxylase alpha subunit
VNKTVSEHLSDLQRHRQRLHEESMRNRLTQQRRNEIEAEIRVITTAMEYFLAAIETEHQMKFD